MQKETAAVGLDEILKKLGPFGKYTIYNYVMIVISGLVSGLIAPAYNFEALDINYRCEVPECELLNTTSWLEYAIPQEKGEFSKCKVFQYNNDTTDKCSLEAFNTSVIQDCDTYVYSDEDSAVKDFDLGCQNWKRTLIGTLHNAGYFIALPLTGLVSDKYGRTIAVSIAAFIIGVCGIARSFSTTYNMMIILEFLGTALGAGQSTSAYVMAMEMVTSRERVLVNLMFNLVQTIGMIILTALAWWLQSWRNLLRIIFSLTFIPTIGYMFLKETPRWLMSKGRYEEAIAVLKYAAKINKVELPQNILKSITFTDNLQKAVKQRARIHTAETVEVQKNKVSLFYQVIKSKIIIIRLLICSYMWISGSFVYYGLTINSVSLSGNRYLNFMLAAIMDFPASIMVFLLLDRLGRKQLISSTFLLGGSMCISLLLLPKDQTTWALILYLCAKFFSKMTYSCIYVYVSEVFPTNTRQTLLSFCSTMGRFGTTLAPLTPLLAFYYKNLPAVFFGVVAVIASILTLMLPETKNVTLPNTIGEAEKMSNKKSLI